MKIVKTRTLLVAGIAGGIGYVLGTKAGTGRYEELRARFEQLRSQADKVAHNEKVQSTVSNLAEGVKAKAEKLPDPVADVVTKAADTVQQSTGATGGTGAAAGATGGTAAATGAAFADDDTTLGTTADTTFGTVDPLETTDPTLGTVDPLDTTSVTITGDDSVIGTAGPDGGIDPNPRDI